MCAWTSAKKIFLYSSIPLLPAPNQEQKQNKTSTQNIPEKCDCLDQ